MDYTLTKLVSRAGVEPPRTGLQPAAPPLSYPHKSWRAGKDSNPDPRCWRPRCFPLHHRLISRPGIEPGTFRLKAGCSTSELTAIETKAHSPLTPQDLRTTPGTSRTSKNPGSESGAYANSATGAQNLVWVAGSAPATAWSQARCAPTRALPR